MISLSILFRTKHILIFSAHAWVMTVCVCADMPSLTSTRTSPPSESLRAELTSLEKSTWPGESIRLMRCCYSSSFLIIFPFSSFPPVLTMTLWPYKMEMDEAFMVIIRCCSSGLESKYLNRPASFLLMILFELINESLIVVFPWSTCAMIQKFRTLSLYYCNS